MVEIPGKSVGFITGYRGESLRRIEAQSGTFCFTEGSQGDARIAEHEVEKVLIFSHDPHNRKKAKRIVADKVSQWVSGPVGQWVSGSGVSGSVGQWVSQSVSGSVGQ